VPPQHARSEPLSSKISVSTLPPWKSFKYEALPLTDVSLTTPFFHLLLRLSQLTHLIHLELLPPPNTSRVMSSMRQPNKTLNEPNRRRSSSDSSIQIECSLRRYRLPDWALPRSDYDIASCSSDDDHERIELDDRKGYHNARRKKLKVRRRWARTMGPAAYEVPRFHEELTEHVRSVEDGPLDADGIEEDEGFFAKLTAPYEPPSPSHGPKTDWGRHPPSPVRVPKSNQHDSQVRRVGCPPGLCSCATEQDVDNDHSSDDDEPVPHLDRNHEMDHDLYTPSGKWEMAKHSPIDKWETLMRIKGVLSG
jgi:hypothetical protein